MRGTALNGAAGSAASEFKPLRFITWSTNSCAVRGINDSLIRSDRLTTEKAGTWASLHKNCNSAHGVPDSSILLNIRLLNRQSEGAKTRRKLQDQRRMAYRRAIEHYAEQCQLQRELADFPELVSASYLPHAEADSRRAA